MTKVEFILKPALNYEFNWISPQNSAIQMMTYEFIEVQ